MNPADFIIAVAGDSQIILHFITMVFSFFHSSYFLIKVDLSTARTDRETLLRNPLAIDCQNITKALNISQTLLQV